MLDELAHKSTISQLAAWAHHFAPMGTCGTRETDAGAMTGQSVGLPILPGDRYSGAAPTSAVKPDQPANWKLSNQFVA